jgi:HD-like signal output (HDOD) protein
MAWRSGPQAAYRRLLLDLRRAIGTGAYRFPPAHSLQLLSCDPEGEADRVVMLAARDPALSGRIAWLASSSIYGDSGPFVSVRSVILRLGPALTREILGHAVMSLYACPPPHFRHWRGQICAQSAGVGFACHALRRALGRDADWAFAAGVLHDCGKAVLIQLLARFPDGLAAPGEMARDLLEQEHSRVGKDIALRHQLAQPLASALTRHHDYDRDRTDDAPAALVALGRRIWRASDRGAGDASCWPEAAVLGLRIHEIERTVEQVASLKPRLLELGSHLEEDAAHALAS